MRACVFYVQFLIFSYAKWNSSLKYWGMSLTLVFIEMFLFCFSFCFWTEEGKMLNLERIPDQVGYLLLTEDGAVISVSIVILMYKCCWNFLNLIDIFGCWNSRFWLCLYRGGIVWLGWHPEFGYEDHCIKHKIVCMELFSGILALYIFFYLTCTCLCFNKINLLHLLYQGHFINDASRTS